MSMIYATPNPPKPVCNCPRGSACNCAAVITIYRDTKYKWARKSEKWLRALRGNSEAERRRIRWIYRWNHRN